MAVTGKTSEDVEGLLDNAGGVSPSGRGTGAVVGFGDGVPLELAAAGLIGVHNCFGSLIIKID